MINVWATVGTVVGYLPMSALTGTPGQLLGMDPTGTFAEWKAATFLSNQLAVPVGGVGAPSFTFTGSLTSGFYRPAADQIGVSIAGVAALNVDANRFLFSKTAQMSGKLLQEDQGADIPAAATTDLGSATGNFLNITNAAGATVVTSMGGATIPAGTEVETVISILGGGVTFTHNAVSLICLGGANVIAQDKDIVRWRKINDAAAYWQMVGLQRGVNTGALTTAGDLLVGLGSGNTGRLGVGADGYSLFADSDPAEKMLWLPMAMGLTVANGYLDWSQNGTVLTVALKGWNGADPSASNPVFLIFRDATVTTGLPVIRKVIVATSASISNTSTIGTFNGIPFRIWCVAFDDGGTVRLGLVNCLTSVANAGVGRDVSEQFALKGWNIGSSTAEGGAGAADSPQIIYSTVAVAAKGYIPIGWASWEAGLAAAGVWSANPTRREVWGLGKPLPGDIIQEKGVDLSTLVTYNPSTIIPDDNTIPQIGEGDEPMSKAITFTSAANVYEVEGQADFTSSAAGATASAAMLCQDAVANSFAATRIVQPVANYSMLHRLKKTMLTLITVATTFRMRVGNGSAGIVYVNGAAGVQIYGGVMNSFLKITEKMG